MTNRTKFLTKKFFLNDMGVLCTRYVSLHNLSEVIAVYLTQSVDARHVVILKRQATPLETAAKQPAFD